MDKVNNSEYQSSWDIENLLLQSKNDLDFLKKDILRESYINNLYSQLWWAEKPDLNAFRCAMHAYLNLVDDTNGKTLLKNKNYLTVVDFSRWRSKNRFYVINLLSKKVEYTVSVWHGKGSWEGEVPVSFSNESWSLQSSLWAFKTPDEIVLASHKRWMGLRLDWLERINNNASDRGIFIHYGEMKKSEWCFILPMDVKPMEIMEKLKGGSLIFAYHPKYVGRYK